MIGGEREFAESEDWMTGFVSRPKEPIAKKAKKISRSSYRSGFSCLNHPLPTASRTVWLEERQLPKLHKPPSLRSHSSSVRPSPHPWPEYNGFNINTLQII